MMLRTSERSISCARRFHAQEASASPVPLVHSKKNSIRNNEGVIFMKKNNAFSRIICLVLTVAIMSCMMAVSVSAASYPTNYSTYSAPSSSDFAYWNGSTVVKASGTTTSEIKWMQASLNYCIAYKGLNASYLVVDGSFGPESKKTTAAFQKKYGLDPDGSYGKATIAKMKSVLATASVPSESKTLSIDWSLIQKTGKQSVSGPCFCYSLAYARDILDKKVHYWKEYVAAGCTYSADRSKAGFQAKFQTGSKVTALTDIYNKIKNCKPVVINVTGGRSSGEHYVCVVGYTGVTSTSKLTEANFLIIDPAGGPNNKTENLASVGYSLKRNYDRTNPYYYYCFA